MLSSSKLDYLYNELLNIRRKIDLALKGSNKPPAVSLSDYEQFLGFLFNKTNSLPEGIDVDIAIKDVCKNLRIPASLFPFRNHFEKVNSTRWAGGDLIYTKQFIPSLKEITRPSAIGFVFSVLHARLFGHLENENGTILHPVIYKGMQLGAVAFFLSNKNKQKCNLTSFSCSQWPGLPATALAYRRVLDDSFAQADDFLLYNLSNITNSYYINNPISYFPAKKMSRDDIYDLKEEICNPSEGLPDSKRKTENTNTCALPQKMIDLRGRELIRSLDQYSSSLWSGLQHYATTNLAKAIESTARTSSVTSRHLFLVIRHLLRFSGAALLRKYGTSWQIRDLYVYERSKHDDNEGSLKHHHNESGLAVYQERLTASLEANDLDSFWATCDTALSDKRVRVVDLEKDSSTISDGIRALLGYEDSTWTSPLGTNSCIAIPLNGDFQDELLLLFFPATAKVVQPLSHDISQALIHFYLSGKNLFKIRNYEAELAEARASERSLVHYGHTLAHRVAPITSFFNGEERVRDAAKASAHLVEHLSLVLQAHTLKNPDELFRQDAAKNGRFLTSESDLDLISHINEIILPICSQNVCAQTGSTLSDKDIIYRYPQVNWAVSSASIKRALLNDLTKEDCRLHDAFFSQLLSEVLINCVRHAKHDLADYDGSTKSAPVLVNISHIDDKDDSWLVVSNYTAEIPKKVLNKLGLGRDGYMSHPNGPSSTDWVAWPADSENDGPGMAIALFRRMELGQLYVKYEAPRVAKGTGAFHVALSFNGLTVA